MTIEDIIGMAREAGEYASVEYERAWKSGYGASWQQIRDERFAALIVAAEREACAYRAGIALLGADLGLANRVDQAIRARGQA